MTVQTIQTVQTNQTHQSNHSTEAQSTHRADAAPADSFDTLQLIDPLRRALRDSGYEAPTPIQRDSIPSLLAGRDMLGCAQTGTGKTAAFALPILQRLAATPHKPGAPRALILAPTRELVVQIADSFINYGRYLRLPVTTVFGGVSQFHQVKALRRGVDILVATPGRLIDLMQQGLVDLSKIQVFVLDEADRMLDMGFIQPIRTISAAVPKVRQTLLYSATMPKEIVHLAESLLRDPIRVTVAPVAANVPKIRQSVYLVERAKKLDLLESLLREQSVERSLIFVRTKHGADKLCRRLEQSGFRAGAIHGNKAQNARQRALEAFRSGRMRVLVATDVAARGIDIDDVSHVFNFDLPFEPESYVHRIGRTGRAGAEGIAIALCDKEERALLRAIESLIGASIERAEGSDASLERGPVGAPPKMRGGGGGGRGGSRGGPNGSHGGSRGDSHDRSRGRRSGGKHGARDGQRTHHAGGRKAGRAGTGAASASSHGGSKGHASHGTRSSSGGAGSSPARAAHPMLSRGWNRPTKRR